MRGGVIAGKRPLEIEAGRLGLPGPGELRFGGGERLVLLAQAGQVGGGKGVVEGGKRAEREGKGYQTLINAALRASLAPDSAPVTIETLRQVLREELRAR
jgi:hypothetical protein